MVSFSAFFTRLLCVAGLLLVCWPLRSQAQTTLRPGDIIITGVNASGTTEFSFVPLVDLAGGTQLAFTDNGWQASGSFLASEGTVTYLVPRGSFIRRGTVVNYKSGQRGNFSAIAGTFQFTTGGDQLLVYQGAAAQPTFVGGVAINSSWTNATTAATSALPPGLLNGVSALALSWDNAYQNQPSQRKGGVNTVRNWFTTLANWTGSSSRLAWSATAPFNQNLTIEADVQPSAGQLPTRAGSGVSRIQHLGYTDPSLAHPIRDLPLYDAASPDAPLCTISGLAPSDVNHVLLKVKFSANSVVSAGAGQPDAEVHNMGNNPFSGKVMLQLSTDAGVLFAPISLAIDNDTPEQTYVLDLSDFFRQYVLPGTATKLLVDLPSYAPGAAAYASNFRLNVDLEEAYYFAPQPVDLPSQPDYLRTDGLLEQQLSWQAACITEDYQLQLLKLTPDELANASTLAALLSNEATWRARATTLDIQTTGSTWQTTLAEGYGTYYYRLRALAPAPGGATNPENWGPWSANAKIELSSGAGAGGPNLAKLNWIYQRTFTEGGRVSEKMTFANGLLQQRQTLTRLASTGQLLGLQTVQDYAGRNAVQSLPIPLTGGDVALNFKPGLLRSLQPSGSAGRQYHAADFDTDATLYSPTQALESGYYTSQPVYNTASPTSDTPALNEGVADAENYPFARTLFTRDGTSRVLEQGGAGATLGVKASQPHTTRTYYASVVQDELTKLMGKEAPLADKTYKIITIDPNNTASITYQTQDGKTIATALAGAGSPNTEKLTSAGAADKVQEKVAEKVDFNGLGSISRKLLVMTQPVVPITITYTITPATFTDDCAPAVCSTCDYQVTINAYRLDDTATPTLVHSESAPLQPGCLVAGTTVVTKTFTTKDPGTYVIEKKVTAFNGATGATTSFVEDGAAALKATYDGYATQGPWPQITQFLAATTPNLEGLYAYLAAQNYPLQAEADGQQYFLVPFGCNASEQIKIQKISCGDCNKAQPAFEKIFTDRWPTASLAAAMPSFPYAGSGDFDTMIQSMLADKTLDYSSFCQQLKECWIGQVESYESQQQAAGDPLAGWPAVDLAQSFLDCASALLVTAAPCPAGTTFPCPPTNVPATLAVGTAAPTPANFYKYARYDVAPAAANDLCVRCLEAALGSRVGLSHPFSDSYAQGLLSSLTPEEATSYAQCRRQGIAPPPAAGSAPVEAQAAEQLSTQLQANCEDRRGEFKQNVLRQAAAQGFVLTDCDAESLADELVQQCKQEATLTATDFQDLPGTTGAPIKIMTAAASERLKNIQLGQVAVAIRDLNVGGSCPAGYTSCPQFMRPTNGQVTVRPSKAAYELISYANELLQAGAKLRAKPRPASATPKGCPATNEGLGETILNNLSYIGSLSAEGQSLTNLYGVDGQPDAVPGRAHYWPVVTWDSTPIDYTYSSPSTTIAYFGVYFPAIVTGSGSGSVQFKTATTQPSAQTSGAPVPTYNLSGICLPTGEEAFGIPKLPMVNNPDTYNPVTHFVLEASQPINPGDIASISAPYTKREFFDLNAASSTSTLGIYVKVFFKDGRTVEATIGHEQVSDSQDFERIVWREGNPCSTMPPSYGACLKWLAPDPTVFLPPANMPLPDPAPSCEQQRGRQLATDIQTQQQQLLAARVLAYRTTYATTCAAPEKLNDTFTVSYELGYHHYTLYYYDRGGNLMKTVPPAGVQLLDVSGPHDDYPSHKMVTAYTYNSLGQMVQQHTPDGGTTSFYYNKAGQLRYSLNDKQRLAKKYSFTQYDALGRAVMVGESTENYSVQRTNGVAELDGPLVNLESLSPPGTASITNTTTTTYTTPATASLPLPQRYLNNRVSYMVAAAHPDDTAPDAGPTTTYYSYDPHGNVEWLVQDLPGLGAKLVRYDYDLLSNKVLQVAYQPGEPDQFFHRYQYDDDNRLTAVETSPDGVLWEQDAQYSYYAHGPLKRTTLGDDRVQGLDYTYTLQGWLKALNHPTLNASQDPGHDGTTNGVAADAFGMVLGYYRGDYQRTGSYLNASGTPGPVLHEPAAQKELFNGNIATWTSRLTQLPGQPATPAVAERYRYDQLNRLLGSSQSLFDTNNQRWTDNKKYLTTYTYDANGNLATLSRHDEQAALMDSLAYHYNSAESNQLSYVTDRITNTPTPEDIESQNADNYGYDEVGNLIRDDQSGVSNIAWTPYGKIARVTNGSDLVYRYDGLGNRISKVARAPKGSGLDDLTTYYVRDASGNILSVYEQRLSQVASTIPLLTLVEQPLYGTSRLGERKPALLLTGRPVGATAPYYGRVLGLKYYELADHLGNVRAVVRDQKTSTLDAATGQPLAASLAPVLSYYASYYPFGQLQPGRYGPANGTSSGVASAYRFGYNGKEKDNNGELGLTTYDYGFRIYNPGLGRFLSVDPLAKKFAWNSTYAFAENDVIRNIDLEGAEKVDAYILGSLTTGTPKIQTTTSEALITLTYDMGNSNYLDFKVLTRAGLVTGRYDLTGASKPMIFTGRDAEAAAYKKEFESKTRQTSLHDFSSTVSSGILGFLKDDVIDKNPLLMKSDKAEERMFIYNLFSDIQTLINQGVVESAYQDYEGVQNIANNNGKPYARKMTHRFRLSSTDESVQIGDLQTDGFKLKGKVIVDYTMESRVATPAKTKKPSK
jgi:RHS repeat-associated protein